MSGSAPVQTMAEAEINHARGPWPAAMGSTQWSGWRFRQLWRCPASV